jgi:hypothetical protein
MSSAAEKEETLKRSARGVTVIFLKKKIMLMYKPSC